MRRRTTCGPDGPGTPLHWDISAPGPFGFRHSPQLRSGSTLGRQCASAPLKGDHRRTTHAHTMFAGSHPPRSPMRPCGGTGYWRRAGIKTSDAPQAMILRRKPTTEHVRCLMRTRFYPGVAICRVLSTSLESELLLTPVLPQRMRPGRTLALSFHCTYSDALTPERGRTFWVLRRLLFRAGRSHEGPRAAIRTPPAIFQQPRRRVCGF